MKMNNITLYAVQALIYMSNSEKDICDLGEISEFLGISEKYLLNGMTKLKRVGLLGSRRGSGGGFYFIASPSRIKLSDVVLELSLEWKQDIKSVDPIEMAWYKAQDAAIKKLGKYSIKKLADMKRTGQAI